MRELIYHALANKLREINPLKWIDWENGQLSQPTEQYPISFPCVLIAFGDFSYEDLPDRAQEGEVAIYLDLYLRRAGDVQGTSPKKEKNLEQLSLLGEISAALHATWQAEGIQSLHRRSESPIATPPDLIGIRQTYEARIIDTHMRQARETRKLSLKHSAINVRSPSKTKRRIPLSLDIDSPHSATEGTTETIQITSQRVGSFHHHFIKPRGSADYFHRYDHTSI